MEECASATTSEGEAVFYVRFDALGLLPGRCDRPIVELEKCDNDGTKSGVIKSGRWKQEELTLNDAS